MVGYTPDNVESLSSSFLDPRDGYVKGLATLCCTHFLPGPRTLFLGVFGLAVRGKLSITFRMNKRSMAGSELHMTIFESARLLN